MISIWTARVRKKDVSSAVQMGFTQSAEGLNTTKNRRTPSFYSCWWTQTGTWLSSAPGLDLPPVAPGSPILHELYHQLHRISSSRTAREETSLPHYYVTQLFIIFIFFSYWFSCSRGSWQRNMYHRMEKLRMRRCRKQLGKVRNRQAEGFGDKTNTEESGERHCGAYIGMSSERRQDTETKK